MLYVLRLLILVTMAALGCSGWAQGQSPVSAKVSPPVATVGDPVVYEVVVEISGTGQPQVAIPVIDPNTGLSTPASVGTREAQNQIISGGRLSVSQTITYQYAVTTSKVGTWEIPPATVTLNGRTYQTNAVKVVVQDMPKAANVPKELEGLVVPPRVQDNPELQRKLTGALFVLPVVTKSNPYNGEQIRISYYLVADAEALKAAGIQPRMHIDGYQIPEMNQFIKEDLFGFPQDPKFKERQIGGKLYSIAPIYETAISSTKTGKLDIEPFQISMIFSMQGRRGGAFNDPFFGNDPFFSGMSPLAIMGGGAARIVAQSPKLTIDVQPLPTEGQPADFTGAVGTFTASAKVNKTKAAAFDDTVELEVVVEGQGDAASLQPPDLGSIKGFQLLGTPQTETAGRKDNENYISSKKFVYTLRPTVPGPQTIPPVKIPYFDPEAEGYAVAESEPIPVQITPGSRPASEYQQAAGGGEKKADDQAGSELRYILTNGIGSGSAGFFTPSQPGRFLLFLLPVALAGFGYLTGKTRNGSAAGMVRKRSRKERAAAPAHLKMAQAALDRGDYEGVCVETAAALRLHFAAKYGIPAADATIEIIEARMLEEGGSASYIRTARDLLEECDAVHYAATRPTAASSREILDRAAATIRGQEAEAA